MSAPEPLTSHQAIGPVMTAMRHGDIDDEKVARRNLAEIKISVAVRRALEASPPLTAEQRHRIASLLRGGAPSLQELDDWDGTRAAVTGVLVPYGTILT